MKKLFVLFQLSGLLLSFSATSIAQTYYVSTTGSDANAGTLAAPFLTLTKAMSFVAPGVIIYLRGGTYNISSTIKTGTSGTAGNYINIWGYAGETVILNFSGETYASTSRGIELNNNYWYLKNLTITNAGDNGIFIGGNNNIVENCQISFNKDTGIQISNGGSNNYIHNCDAFDNNDPATNGQNADGIDVKLNAGAGNVIRGCHVFNNADDGYDCYQTANTVVFDSCWAFHNGYNLWGIVGFTGNGNGFKLGGNFVAGLHKVTHCISFDNVVKGFDQNNNTGGVTLYNCTSYRNGTYNFSFPTVPTTGQDTLKNNISYLSTGVHLEASSLQQTNSWNGSFTVNASSFMSLDTSLATIARSGNGYLPATNFLHLAAGSDMIDAGVDVGLPYNGIAPDLGAFETNNIILPVSMLSFTAVANNNNVTLNWRMSSEINNKGWNIERASTTAPSVWTTVGFLNGAGNSSTANSYAYFDKNVEAGTYYYRLKQIDVNGNETYSNSILVKIINGLPGIEIRSYPNPFHSSATISFTVPVNEKVIVQVFNMQGQLVNTIANESLAPGSYQKLINGERLSRGQYLLKLTEGQKTITGTIIKF